MPATAFVARRQWVAEEGLRLDAGAYAGGALAARDRIVGGRWAVQRLDGVADAFTESRFTRTYVTDPKHGIPYITASDMLLADLKGLLFLSRRATTRLSKLYVSEGWTLMSCSGTIGRTSYVRAEMAGMAASHDVIRIIPRLEHVAAGYLFAFLSSAPAQAMIQQRTYGSVVQHIEPHHLADIPVPLPDPAVQQRIHDLVAGAAAARTEASRLLDEAGAYFDGLAGPMPSQHYHARSVRTIPRTDIRSRLDAVFHTGWAAEPRFDGSPITDHADVWRIPWIRRVWADRGVPYGTGSFMFFARPSPEHRVAKWAAAEAKAIVEFGDVLVQAYGQLNGLMGRPTYVGRRSAGWAIGDLLLRVRCKNEADRGSTFAFLRSESGRRSLLRHSSGNQIPFLLAPALRSLTMPPVPRELAKRANEALALREQADAHEEQAIREVESWLT